MLRRIGIIAVLSLIIAAAAAVPALAVAPVETTRSGGLHFVGLPDADKNVVLDDEGNIVAVSLTATGEVAGAGTGGTATLSSTATVTQGCVTRGGGEPSGLERSTTTVTGSEPFTTDQGRGTFTVTTGEITAPSGGFECPSRQQTEVLVGVIFNDPLLTINAQTGTITALFPDIDP